MKTLKVLLQEVVSGIKTWVNSNFAQESNAVHKTGNETVNEDKTLTGTTTFSGNVACNQNCQFTKRVNPSEITDTSDCNFALNALSNVVFFNTRGSSNYKGYGSFLWTGYNSDSAPDRYGQIQLLRSTDKYGDTNDGRVPDPTFKMWRVATYYNVMDFMESVRVQNDGSVNFMIPISNNVTDLGTSDNRWKSFNGINPGALSLPSESPSQTNLDPTNWNTTGTAVNKFTPPTDGWLGVQVQSADTTNLTGQYVFAGRSTGGETFWPSAQLSNLVGDFESGKLVGCVMIPVIAGKEYHVRIKMGKTLKQGSKIYASFYPCLGNV